MQVDMERNKILFIARPNFSARSSRIRVDLLSYESKTTDKRQQNDWRAKKNLDRCSDLSSIQVQNKVLVTFRFKL